MFDFGNANDGQRQAISTTEGPVLITAGPGTGKTYTLVQRAIYLIEERGVKPEDIFIAKSELQLKREAEAEVVREGNKLVIRSFYPMNLMQKLSLQKEYVEDWKQLVESIMIDWNYDGVVMQPMVTDVPDKKEFVAGIYDIPEDAGTIKVKITDLLSESLEVEV